MVPYLAHPFSIQKLFSFFKTQFGVQLLIKKICCVVDIVPGAGEEVTAEQLTSHSHSSERGDGQLSVWIIPNSDKSVRRSLQDVMMEYGGNALWRVGHLSQPWEQVGMEPSKQRGQQVQRPWAGMSWMFAVRLSGSSGEFFILHLTSHLLCSFLWNIKHAASNLHVYRFLLILYSCQTLLTFQECCMWNEQLWQ